MYSPDTDTPWDWNIYRTLTCFNHPNAYLFFASPMGRVLVKSMQPGQVEVTRPPTRLHTTAKPFPFSFDYVGEQ